MEEYIPICPSVRLYVCHSFTAYYRQRSADISGQIPFLFGLFLRPALRNPVLPLRFQINAETPRAVAADHVNVFFIQELRERLGGNAVPFVFVFGIPDAESLMQITCRHPQSVFGGVVLMCLLLAALGKELADVVPCLPLGLRPILDFLRNFQAVAQVLHRPLHHADEHPLGLGLNLLVKVLVRLTLPRLLRIVHEGQPPFDDVGTAPEGGIVRLCLRQFVGGHDREVRLEPRGHLLVHQAAGRDEAAARELLELRQGEFLPVLGLVDPRYAHTSQGQHVRGRRRTVLRLLLLEEHFNLHVAGQRHAEDVRHQLDQGILAVSPMLAPKNDEHMFLAVADQAVSRGAAR